MAGKSGEMLLFTRFGPRTDVRYMTRAQLLKSGTQFLVSGLALLGGALALALLFVKVIQPEIIGFAMFPISIISGMGILGGLYLCVRGALRDGSYDPEAVWRADQEKWLAEHPNEVDEGPRRFGA